MSANKLFRRRSSDAAVRRAGQPAPSVHTQCSLFACEVLSQFHQRVQQQAQAQHAGVNPATLSQLVDAHSLAGLSDPQLCSLCTEITWDIQWLYGVPRICRELYNLVSVLLRTLCCLSFSFFFSLFFMVSLAKTYKTFL